MIDERNAAASLTVSVAEGVGWSGGQRIPRPIVLFLEWSREAAVCSRFNEFYEEHAAAFAACDGEAEQAHENYAIFQSYEHFFEQEVASFLSTSEETDLDEFSRAAEVHLKRRGRPADDEKCDDAEECGGPDDVSLLLDLAMSSLDYDNFLELMRGYSARLKEAAEAAEDMGL